MAKPQRLLNVNELAEILGLPRATIYQWSVKGKGPRPIRIGRHLRYRVVDVERYIDAQGKKDWAEESSA